MLPTLVALLTAAVVFVLVSRRLGFGSILGYLVAGVVIGPSGLRLVKDVEQITEISELGVLMLLFLIGLELRLPRLCRRSLEILRRLCGLRRRLRILLDMARLCPGFCLLKPVGAGYSEARARDRRRRSDSRRIASARAARSSGEKVPATS